MYFYLHHFQLSAMPKLEFWEGQKRLQDKSLTSSPSKQQIQMEPTSTFVLGRSLTRRTSSPLLTGT
jgi:hypothetical protein